MGHLSILTCIKVHYNQNTVIGFRIFLNFTIFDQKLCFKFLGKKKNYKSHSGIRTHDLQIRS